MAMNLAIQNKGQGRGDNVIQLPDRMKTRERIEEEEAQFGTGNALWESHDSGINAALLALPNGPSCQAVYTALLRRLPNVFPGLTRLEEDSGKSRSMVTRALNILEEVKLITRHRITGRNTEYNIADLRNPIVVRECLRKIGQLRNRKSAERARKRNAKSKARVSTRCTDATSTRCMDATQLGAPVHPKDINKKQTKIQEAAKPLDVVVDAVSRKTSRSNDQLAAALRKWGLLDAAWYLLNPDHEKAVKVLIDNPEDAVALIDKTMSRNSWKSTDGIRLRVWFLRKHIAAAVSQIEAERMAKNQAIQEAKRKARKLLSRLPKCDMTGIDDLPAKKREELLKSGLSSLCDDVAVVEIIRSSDIACRRIVANELESEHLHEEVKLMSDEDLQNEIEKIRSSYPGLSRFMQRGNIRAERSVIRPLIVSRLREERKGRVDSGRLRHESRSALS